MNAPDRPLPAPFEGLSDSELAGRAQAGAVDAFEELARRHQAPLLQFLQSRTGCRAEAEDVLQETFLKAYVNLATFQPAQSFRAWLFTIAYNQMIQQHRSAAARRRLLKSYDHPAETRRDDAGAEDRQQLWSAARAVLGDEPFAALWLFHVEELSLKEIARVLKRNPITVRVLLFRARQKLKLALPVSRASLPAAASTALRSPVKMEGLL